MNERRRQTFFQSRNAFAHAGEPLFDFLQTLLNGNYASDDIVQPLILAMAGHKQANQQRDCDLKNGQQLRRNMHYLPPAPFFIVRSSSRLMARSIQRLIYMPSSSTWRFTFSYSSASIRSITGFFFTVLLRLHAM